MTNGELRGGGFNGWDEVRLGLGLGGINGWDEMGSDGFNGWDGMGLGLGGFN